MKRLIVMGIVLSMVEAGVLASLSASFSNSVSGSSPSSSTITYTSPISVFTFGYPSNWTTLESITLTSPGSSDSDLTPEIINIQTERLPPGTTLAEYTESGINHLTSLPRQNFSITDSSPTTLAGLPAYTVTYTFTNDQLPITINNELMQIWAIDNSTDTAYVITYVSTVEEFNDGLPALRAITDSFQIESSDLS